MGYGHDTELSFTWLDIPEKLAGLGLVTINHKIKNQRLSLKPLIYTVPRSVNCNSRK